MLIYPTYTPLNKYRVYLRTSQTLLRGTWQQNERASAKNACNKDLSKCVLLYVCHSSSNNNSGNNNGSQSKMAATGQKRSKCEVKLTGCLPRVNTEWGERGREGGRCAEGVKPHDARKTTRSIFLQRRCRRQSINSMREHEKKSFPNHKQTQQPTHLAFTHFAPSCGKAGNRCCTLQGMLWLPAASVGN